MLQKVGECGISGQKDSWGSSNHTEKKLLTTSLGMISPGDSPALLMELNDTVQSLPTQLAQELKWKANRENIQAILHALLVL